MSERKVRLREVTLQIDLLQITMGILRVLTLAFFFFVSDGQK